MVGLALEVVSLLLASVPVSSAAVVPLALRGSAHESSRRLSEAVQCSFQSFPVDHTIAANAIAASSDVYPDFAPSSEMDWGVDLAGLWWMMGNPLAEEFVSFRGTTVTSSNAGDFPKVTSSPSNLRGRWVWPNSWKGTFLMSYYALSNLPTVPQVASWTNESYTVIGPIAGGSSDDSGFQYVLRKDESDATGDTWIRENLDNPDDDTPEYQYTLVRVINGDGIPNARYWPEFLEYANEHDIESLQIWGNDNSCMRACETALWCSLCKWRCGVE